MTVIVRPSKELIEYFKHKMLGCVIAHMTVKPDIDVDGLLNSLVEYFYRAYGRRYSLNKEMFKEIADSVKNEVIHN
jgi:hypothetical protein